MINRLHGKKNLFNSIFLARNWHPADHISFQSSHPGSDLFDEIQLPAGSKHEDSRMQIMWPDHCIQNTFGAQYHRSLLRLPTDIEILKGKNREFDSESAFGNELHDDTGLLK